MKAVVAIARSHFRQQWKLALLPVGGGLLSYVLHALRGGAPPTWMAQTLAVFAVCCFAPVVAVLLGVEFVGLDLRHRRLSFYLSRPCPAWQLWFGRLLAALLILGVSMVGALMGLPDFPGGFDRPGTVARAVAVLVVILFLVTNALTCIRLSFAWDAIVLDVAAGALVLSTASSLSARLNALAPLVAFKGAVAVLGWAVVALVPASLALLWGGRGRERWGHRWFSWTFWPVFGLSMVGLGVALIKEANTPLAAGLGRVVIGAPLDRDRVLVGAWGRGGHPLRSFVVSAETGATERVGWGMDDSVRSANGSFIAWKQEGFLRRPSSDTVVVARTADLESPLREIKVGWGLLSDVSDDGQRALFGTRDGLMVFDTSSGKVVGEVRFPPSTDELRSARLVDDRSFQAEVWEASVFRLLTLSFTGDVLLEKRIERPSRARLFVHIASGRYAVADETRIVMYNGDEKAIGTMAGANAWGFFTKSGALVVRMRDTVAILLGDGTVPRLVPVSGSRINVAGALESGEVVVGFEEEGRPRTVLIDPVTATIRQSLDGVRPLAVMQQGHGGTGVDTLLRVLRNVDGDLLYLDPGATKLRLLVKSTGGDF